MANYEFDVWDGAEISLAALDSPIQAAVCASGGFCERAERGGEWGSGCAAACAGSVDAVCAPAATTSRDLCPLGEPTLAKVFDGREWGTAYHPENLQWLGRSVAIVGGSCRCLSSPVKERSVCLLYSRSR